jgi:hypothetical protein
MNENYPIHFALRYGFFLVAFLSLLQFTFVSEPGPAKLQAQEDRSAAESSRFDTVESARSQNRGDDGGKAIVDTLWINRAIASATRCAVEVLINVACCQRRMMNCPFLSDGKRGESPYRARR